MEKTQDKIGNIFTKGERDAVHVAVLPVIASSELNPGQNIGYSNGKTTHENAIGIVDPFLKSNVHEGEMFFIFLYPNTITSLNHNWTHPSILDVVEPSSDSKEFSEKWLRNFAENSDCPSYEALINGAVNNNDGEYLHFDDMDAHGDIPPEFWRHVEVVTGNKIPESNKATYFSCSC